MELRSSHLNALAGCSALVSWGHPGRALPSSPSLKKHSRLADVSRLHHQASLYNTKYEKLSNSDKVVVFIRQLRLRNSIKRRPRKREHPANNDATLQPCVQCVLIASDEAK